MNICIDNRDENLFSIDRIDFIKFPEHNGMTPMITKTYWSDEYFGGSNNFATSYALRYLQEDVLPRMERAIGAENIVEFETDLTALDGDDSYGVVKSRISIPTFEFYHNNKAIFDKYPGYYWWTATPCNTFDNNVLAIYPYGDTYVKYCERFNGIRPMIMLKSSVFNL